LSRVGEAGETDHASKRDAEARASRLPAHRVDALRIFALTRNRSFRTTLVPAVSRIRYRDLDAVVKPASFGVPALNADALSEHQRVVEACMRGSTVLPMPYGVVFRDRRELIRWLEDQYLSLDEALSFLDGHWELRLHMVQRGDPEAGSDAVDFAAHIYAELRRIAHAALPLSRSEGRLFSAAFLVPRTGWVEFVEHAEDLVARDSRLSLDVTGPWPAYDFVRIAR
jgi:Gas vesicle synthesis protein GvpL/GvpF